MRVFEQLATTLVRSGVEHVFTVMGEGNLHLIDALAERGVQIIHARHEQGAVAMADGYSRARGVLNPASAEIARTLEGGR